jgi:predicted SAM-dependent methyltransferase/SAM-dependent methyltransferase
VQLNLGCGDHHAPTPWQNVDFGSPCTPDVVCDLRGPLPWPRGSVTRVYCGHVLEHLTVPEATSLLARLAPLMVPGGQIMVVGPDVDRGRQLHADGLVGDELWEVMRAGAGAKRWPGDTHEWDCEPRTLARMLQQAGWSDIAEVPINEVPGSWPVVARVEWQCAVGAVRKEQRHMCHPSVLAYAAEVLEPAQVAGRWVLEVGSYDVNGSVRTVLAPMGPAAYVGVDQSPGPGVDEVVDCEVLADWAAGTCFDLVISTEMLEHVRDWQTCLRNLLEVVADGGLLLVTTRSQGFPWHGFPEDHWRYSVEAMGELLTSAGFEVVDLRPDPDPASPGVFALTRRPDGWAWPVGKTPEGLWVGIEVTPV